MATGSSLSTPRVDTHLGKFSQGCTVALTALAFLFNLPVLVAITTVIMAWSVLHPASSPYRLLYRGIIVPLGLLKPRIVEDDPAPHRFAQAIGTVFLLAATLDLSFSGATVVGWVLVLIVLMLAGINLFVGFCMGCFVYYHLGRFGVLPKVRYEGAFHWRGV